MRKSASLPLLILSSAALAACHTDPFSIKPEVPGVQIPEKPGPTEPETPEQENSGAAETQPDSF